MYLISLVHVLQVGLIATKRLYVCILKYLVNKPCICMILPSVTINIHIHVHGLVGFLIINMLSFSCTICRYETDCF